MLEPKVHFCFSVESGEQSHFTVEAMKLAMAYPQLTHRQNYVERRVKNWRSLAAALSNPFFIGTEAVWNRPQQNGATNLRLWAEILMGRLGNGWVV